MLVVFATPRENPFPVHLEKGEAVLHEGMLLLLAGIGERSAERLEQTLVRHPEVSQVIEYGGAAAVHGSEIGVCYTVTRLFDRDGGVRGTLPVVAGLVPAATVCDNALYRGETFSWAGAAGLPLLYTMETAFLAPVCRRHRIPFYSLRRATDDGRGDVRGRYERVLADSRAETLETLLVLREGFVR